MGANRNEGRKRADAPSDKPQRRIGAGKGREADWSAVDGDKLAAAVAAVAKQGGALRLGYTRDGGAYAIGVYGDGKPYTDYIGRDGDIDEYLDGLVAVWNE